MTEILQQHRGGRRQCAVVLDQEDEKGPRRLRSRFASGVGEQANLPIGVQAPLLAQQAAQLRVGLLAEGASVLKKAFALTEQAQQLACLRRRLARWGIIGRGPVGAATHEMAPEPGGEVSSSAKQSPCRSGWR